MAISCDTYAPATFECLMEQVLAGLPLSTCLVYLDDILVPGCTFKEKIHNLQQVFERLQSAGLKLSPKKCSLFRKEVKYVGHVVKKQGVTMDPEKVQAVQEWPRPTNATEVKRFLGLCSYYRRFIKGFADIAQPLHQCTEKIQSFNWTPEVEQAFLKLKHALTEAPVLGYPNPDDPFILDTDASSYGTGAVLSQLRDGQEHVIAYYSQVLNRPERQYCTTRRELLAVVKAVKHFHPYVYGRPFSVRTDHAALRWLLSFRHPKEQTARWLERLKQYDLQIEYRPGIKHGNADALSRRPCLHVACKHCDRLESKEHHHRKAEEVPIEYPWSKQTATAGRCSGNVTTSATAGRYSEDVATSATAGRYSEDVATSATAERCSGDVTTSATTRRYSARISTMTKWAPPESTRLVWMYGGATRDVWL